MIIITCFVFGKLCSDFILLVFSYIFITLNINSSQVMAQTQHRLETPQDYIEYLKRDDLSVKSIFKNLESLQVALRSNKIQWVQEFAQKGLKCLLSILNECYRR